MKKIEKQMIQALSKNKDFSLSNTMVRCAGNPDTNEYVRHVYLHGNEIACVKDSENCVLINLCGWNTPTTRSRINAVLSQYLPNLSVCNRKKVLYMHDRKNETFTEIANNEWLRLIIKD